MSLEQYKDASRKELWDILQIQMQVLQAETAKVAELEKERDVRDLEQQAKGVEDAVTKLERPDVPLAPSLILNDDLLDFAAVLRNQAKALKEQGNG